jgi:hypothetical protein
MPVVHRHSFTLKGEGGKLFDFVRVTKYDSNRKRFTISLPEWWSKTLGYSEIGGETDAQVESAWRMAQENFEKLSTNRRKIILYTFESSAILSVTKKGDFMADCMGEDFDHVIFRSQGCGQEHSMSFTKGTALDVWFIVGYECTSSFMEYAIFTDLKGQKVGDARDKDLRLMDWTPEREGFFVAFDLELSKLIYKLDTFLNGASTEMAKLIDQHKSVFALPVPDKQKEGN